MRLIPITENNLSDIIMIQKAAFQKLYKKYQDHQTSPYTQTLAGLQEKYRLPNNYFFLIATTETIGFIRVVTYDSQTRARIAPIGILPNKENQGYGSHVLQLIETTFPTVMTWQLSTILQEEKLIHFYQKAGYHQQKDTQEIQENMTITFFTKNIFQKKQCNQ